MSRSGQTCRHVSAEFGWVGRSIRVAPVAPVPVSTGRPRMVGTGGASRTVCVPCGSHPVQTARKRPLGRPFMVDMDGLVVSAVTDALRGVYGPCSGWCRSYVRWYGDVTPSRRLVNAPWAAFRGQYGREAASPASGAPRPVFVVVACENGQGWHFRHFRSNRLFFGNFTAKHEILRKIYSRVLGDDNRAMKHRRSHFLHNRP